MANIKSLPESRADPSVNHEDADGTELRKRNPTPITTIVKAPLVVGVNLGSGSKTTSIRSRRGSRIFTRWAERRAGSSQKPSTSSTEAPHRHTWLERQRRLVVHRTGGGADPERTWASSGRHSWGDQLEFCPAQLCGNILKLTYSAADRVSAVVWVEVFSIFSDLQPQEEL